MDPIEFTAAVSGTSAAATIRCAGDLNVRADAAMEAAYAEAARLGASHITLDFERVGYINSTGIALIVRLLADARSDRREVRVCGLSAHYLEIFQITRLSDYMRIFDDQASATAAAPSTSSTPATAATSAASTGGRR